MRQLKITKQVTNRETASLDKYLQEIGRVDLITAEEEVELARKIKAGDQAALEKLTNLISEPEKSTPVNTDIVSNCRIAYIKNYTISKRKPLTTSVAHFRSVRAFVNSEK